MVGRRFRRRFGRRVAAIGAMAVGVVGMYASAAAAHGTDGLVSVEVDSRTENGRGTVVVRARVVYAGDGDPASNATVRLEGSAPGTALPPTVMESTGDGTYTAAVTLPSPGTWTFRVTSIEPNATAEVSYSASSTSSTSSGSGSSSSISSSSSSSSSATADNGSGGSGDRSATGTHESTGAADDDGWLLPAVVVILLVLVGGGLLALARRRRAYRASPSSGSP